MIEVASDFTTQGGAWDDWSRPWVEVSQPQADDYLVSTATGVDDPSNANREAGDSLSAQGKTVDYIGNVDDVEQSAVAYWQRYDNVPDAYTICLIDHGGPYTIGMGCGINDYLVSPAVSLDATKTGQSYPTLDNFISALEIAADPHKGGLNTPHLTKLIIWECNVAKGDSTKAMLQRIAYQSGVDIVAYDNSVAQGTRWYNFGLGSLHYYVKQGTTEYTFHGDSYTTRVMGH